MDKQRIQSFMHKVVGDVATTLAATLLLVGERTGLFKAMAGAGPLTAVQLAEHDGIAPRYAEEWLAAMAGAGYVDYDADGARFTRPDEPALMIADPASESHLLGLFSSLPTMTDNGRSSRLNVAFRSRVGAYVSPHAAPTR